LADGHIVKRKLRRHSLPVFDGVPDPVFPEQIEQVRQVKAEPLEEFINTPEKPASLKWFWVLIATAILLTTATVFVALG